MCIQSPHESSHSGRNWEVRQRVRSTILQGPLRTHSSRNKDKGRVVAGRLQTSTVRDINGGTNEAEAKKCDAAVLAIPSLESIMMLR